MERLLSGYQRFRAGDLQCKKALFQRLAEAPHQPCHTLVVACSDSRVVPELIVDAQPGELFVVRNVANIVPPLASPESGVGAALQYAMGHLPAIERVIVWGHYGCGGVKALLDGPEALEAEPHVRTWASLAEEARLRLLLEGEAGSTQELWDRLVELNVLLQLEHLLSYPAVAEAVEAGRLQLHGWLYDLASARLKAYHPEGGFQWVADGPPGVSP
ncbi:MAG: carbonic anhydrase [Candidatus Tectimicrobiota bacterium]